MPEITHHVPGMFSWTELSTTDENAALRFYGSLFGWTDDPQPMGEGATYHMQQVKGLPTAAIYGQMEEERQQGVPPNWRAYFTVASADDTARRVQEAGGRVLAGPLDVFDSGRMIVAQDPQGAVFAAWQPNQHIGARVMTEPGAITWAEVLTSDARGAEAFYTAVLQVQSEKMPGPMDYTLLKAEGQNAAGIMQPEDLGQMPPAWMVYFTVADCDAAVAKAQSLGGGVLVPATDIPGVGRFAWLHDPQRAAFGILQPAGA